MLSFRVRFKTKGKIQKENEGKLMEAAGEIFNGKKANKSFLPDY